MYVEKLRDAGEWEDFLRSTPQGTFFHSVQWKEVLERSFPHSALYLTVKDAEDVVVGICPGFVLGQMRVNIYDSTPCSDFGGPIIRSGFSEEASRALQGYLQRHGQDHGIAYAKFCFTDAALSGWFRSPSSRVEVRKGVMVIDLQATPTDVIWRRVFSQNRRRKIRLVERKGFQARVAGNKSDLKAFYALYRENMRHIGAKPYDYSFVENMWDLLHPDGLRVCLVEKDRVVAGMLCFRYHDKLHTFLAGMDRTQRIHGLHNYLYWHEIQHADEAGLRYVCLGSTPSDPQHVNYRQKMQFGSTYHQQEQVWYPLTYGGRFLLKTRAMTVAAWRSMRHVLPPSWTSIVERKLARF